MKRLFQVLLLVIMNTILSQAADILRIPKKSTTATTSSWLQRNATTTGRPKLGKSAIDSSATFIRTNATSIKPQATYFFTNVGPNSFEYRGMFTGKTAFDISKHFAAFFDHLPNVNDHKGKAFNLLQPRTSPDATPPPPVLVQFHPPPPQPVTNPPVLVQYHPPPAQQLTTPPPVIHDYVPKIQQYGPKIQQYEPKIQQYEPKIQQYEPKIQDYGQRIQEYGPRVVQGYDFFRLSPNPNPPPPPQFPPPVQNRYGFEHPQHPFANAIQSERPTVDFDSFQPDLPKYHIVRGQARAESYPKIFKFVDGRINIVDFEKKKKSRKDYNRLQKGDALDPDRVLRNKFLILHGGMYDRNQQLLNGYGGSRGTGYFGNSVNKKLKYDPEFSEYFYRT